MAAAKKQPVKWQYNDRGWQTFDEPSTDQIEQAYIKCAQAGGANPKIKLTVGFFAGKNYEFDCVRMKQRNLDTGMERDCKDVRARPVVGDRLMLRPNAEANDVLKPGEIGEMTADDRDSTPFKIKNPTSKKEQYFKENQVFVPTLLPPVKIFMTAKIWDKFDPKDPELPETVYGDQLVPMAAAFGVDLSGGDGYLMMYLLSSTELTVLRKVQCVKPDGLDTEAKVKEAMKKTIAELKASPDKFKEFWTWLFRYLINDPDPRRRTHDFESCSATWDLYLKEFWPMANAWKKYINVVKARGKQKPIASDVWECLLEFARKYPNLDKFEDDGSWPSLFDGFFSNEGDWQSAP